MIEENTGSIPQMNRTKKRGFFRRYFALILILLVLVLTATSVYFYKKSTTNENQVSQAEVKSLIGKVGRIAVLPSDETPTIATVSDPEALRDQAFFADAKKGDKVLIYSNAKKAFLYDPVADKIVNIAPLNTASGPDNTPITNTSTEM